MKPAAQTGFTLIELLVALAVLGIALGALLAGLARYADQTGYLRQKTIAVWVAHNQLVTVELEPALPGSGTRDGSTEMGGVEYVCWRSLRFWFYGQGLRLCDLEKICHGQLVRIQFKVRSSNANW